mmetsp:Transcript_55129/g.112775  ORF Transcript_55129/g.112775 Transcript_55129/m.112775 type:complete len:82 (+) Transcript_55129:854-1099(+)
MTDTGEICRLRSDYSVAALPGTALLLLDVGSLALDGTDSLQLTVTVSGSAGRFAQAGEGTAIPPFQPTLQNCVMHLLLSAS